MKISLLIIASLLIAGCGHQECLTYSPVKKIVSIEVYGGQVELEDGSTSQVNVISSFDNSIKAGDNVCTEWSK